MFWLSILGFGVVILIIIILSNMGRYSDDKVRRIVGFSVAGISLLTITGAGASAVLLDIMDNIREVNRKTAAN